MNIAESRGESEIVAEPGLGVGIDAGVEIGFTFGKRLEHACQRIHAAGCDNSRDDRAKTPVAVPKARGSDQVPAPTIEPTTIMVCANSENFCVCSEATAAGVGAANTASRLSVATSSLKAAAG